MAELRCFLCAAEAFAELEADEAQVQGALAGTLDDDLADRLLRVLHEGLLHQDGLLVELLDLALGDPLDDVRRLSGRGRLGSRDLALGLQGLRADLRPHREARVRRRDVHRQILAEGLVAARDSDHDADAAVAVDVARELLARAGHEAGEAPDLDVLLERRDQLRDGVPDGLAGWPRQLRDLRDVARARVAEGVVRGDPVSQLLGERPEVLGSRHEVRLAVDLEEHGALERDVGDDETLGRGAAGLRGRGGQTLLAEDLLGLFEVALRLHQRLLAIHHPGARFGAQVGHELGRDLHDSPQCAAIADDPSRQRSANSFRNHGPDFVRPVFPTRRSPAALRRVGDDGGLRELRRPRTILGGRFLGPLALPVGVQPLEDRVGHLRREEPDGADRVVVARDHVVHEIRIAVRVDDGDDRDAENVRFLDGDVLLLGIDHEERVGKLVHLLDAGQILLELLLLPLEPQPLLLGQVLVVVLREDALDLLQTMDRLADRGEVGQRPAEPAGVHVEHAAAVGLFVDRILGLALRADEQQVLARGGKVGHELRGFLELLERLLQVDDVDPVALAEDELLHLRIPAFRLMTEVDASLEQFLHRNRCQITPPFP